MADAETGIIDNRLLFQTLKDIRSEIRRANEMAVKTADHSVKLQKQLFEMERRLSDRITTLADDLELMVKAELLGRLTHFETRMDDKIDLLLSKPSDEDRIKD